MSQELENEDLEFVRACRGRLAKHLQTKRYRFKGSPFNVPG